MHNPGIGKHTFKEDFQAKSLIFNENVNFRILQNNCTNKHSRYLILFKNNGFFFILS